MQRTAQRMAALAQGAQRVVRTLWRLARTSSTWWDGVNAVLILVELGDTDNA
jgi:hypothetical protein